MCSCTLCILIVHVSSQSVEEGEVVHLQYELLETNAKMTQLDGECCNGTILKKKHDRVVALQMS